jgi:hypothetical protein
VVVGTEVLALVQVVVVVAVHTVVVVVLDIGIMALVVVVEQAQCVLFGLAQQDNSQAPA